MTPATRSNWTMPLPPTLNPPVPIPRKASVKVNGQDAGIRGGAKAHSRAVLALDLQDGAAAGTLPALYLDPGRLVFGTGP